MKSVPESARPSREQMIYANILTMGVWFGVFVLLVTYCLYVGGVLAPSVPIEEIPQHWTTGVDKYLETTNSPTGWGWTALVTKGDFVNYLGFVVLALLTVLCYSILLPLLIKRRDKVLAVICALEIIVLLVAASGVLGGGGH